MLRLVSVDLIRRTVVHLVLGLLSLVLFACSTSSPGETSVPTIGETATPLPVSSATPLPTETSLPRLVVLLVPPGADAELSNALQVLLTELSSHTGLRMQVLPSLTQSDLEGVQVVVAVPPDLGLGELVRAAPETSFLAIGIPGLEPADNLSVIDSPGGRPDQVGFLAGYTAATITPDWRVGVVAEAGTPSGNAARLGFTNGVFYFCGLCRPVYPPFPTSGYPLFVEIPAGAGPADWDSTITHFNAWQAETVFVDPAVAAPEFLAALAQAGFNLILVGPPPVGLNEHWVASIGAADGATRAAPPLVFRVSSVPSDSLRPGRGPGGCPHIS